MKGKKKGIIAITVTLIILALLGLIASYFIFVNQSYTDILEKNWEMKFPGDYQTEFEAQEDGSIFGDGYRYHVLSLSPEEMKTLNPPKTFADMMSGDSYPEVYQIAKSLNVPKEQLPPENLVSYRLIKASGEYLMIIPDERAGKLYIAESFL